MTMSIKRSISLTLLALALVVSVPLPALAASACGGSSSSTFDTSCLPNPAGTDSTSYLNRAVTVVFSIAASVALLLIVINGLRYITARGDPNAVASARNGMLYALVGLVVIMAAYGIVAFVVKGTS